MQLNNDQTNLLRFVTGLNTTYEAEFKKDRKLVQIKYLFALRAVLFSKYEEIQKSGIQDILNAAYKTAQKDRLNDLFGTIPFKTVSIESAILFINDKIKDLLCDIKTLDGLQKLFVFEAEKPFASVLSEYGRCESRLSSAIWRAHDKEVYLTSDYLLHHIVILFSVPYEILTDVELRYVISSHIQQLLSLRVSTDSLLSEGDNYTIFVDGDNISPAVIYYLIKRYHKSIETIRIYLSELAKFHIRLYDFMDDYLKKTMPEINHGVIDMIPVDANIKGKSATDSRFQSEAIRYCLKNSQKRYMFLSSDSDYRSMCQGLLEDGIDFIVGLTEFVETFLQYDTNPELRSVSPQLVELYLEDGIRYTFLPKTDKKDENLYYLFLKEHFMDPKMAAEQDRLRAKHIIIPDKFIDSTKQDLISMFTYDYYRRFFMPLVENSFSEEFHVMPEPDYTGVEPPEDIEEPDYDALEFPAHLFVEPEQEVLEEKNQHSWSDWIAETEPSCDNPGTESRQCSACGEAETREIPALGHDVGDWEMVKEPTCSEEG